MKTNLLKYYITAFYIFSTFVMVAQTAPGDDTSGGGLESDGDATPAAPVDGYVWVLATLGLVYVFLRLRAFAQQQKTPQE